MAGNRGAVAGLGVIKAIVWIVYAIASAAIIVLAFAFVLLMFDANPNNAFAELITDWGSAFARPFVGLIRPTALPNGGILAWSLLVAIAAYAVVAWVVGLLLGSVSASRRRAAAARDEARVAASSGTQMPASAPAETAPTQGAAVSGAMAEPPNPQASIESKEAVAESEPREAVLVGVGPSAENAATTEEKP